MNPRILVVGAGLSGVTIARELAENDYSVDVIDKRNHIAGNAYDFIDENGFRIHKYGPHLFHTNNQDVVKWLSRFTEWIPYKHKVKALLNDGSYVTLPPNIETQAKLGRAGIIDILFRPYTKKMWGLELEELDPKIIKRIPIQDNENEFYFPNDDFQALPRNGYTSLVARILDHENIAVSLSTEFNKKLESDFLHVFNSMPIDSYFDYCHGPLPYRSIKFTHLTFPTSTLLPTATVNFTHNGPHTRVTEWRHLPGHGSSEFMTALTYEEPCDYMDNDFERYYPVKDVHGLNRQLYKAYREMVGPNMTFIGRCGQYVYLDMHQAVASSLAEAQRFLRNSTGLEDKRGKEPF
jgi:UDP-galactopyranose mutase